MVLGAPPLAEGRVEAGGRDVKLLCAVFVAMLLSGCGFVFDERIDGPYRLVAVDTMDEMHVCFDMGHGDCHGRTPPTTYGYGWNERYIVAVTTSRTGYDRAPNPPGPEYWYIDRSRDRRGLNDFEITQGPFTSAEFATLRGQLGLPPITREIEPLKLE